MIIYLFIYCILCLDSNWFYVNASWTGYTLYSRSLKSSRLLTGPERSLRTAPWMRMSFEPGQSLPATSGLSSSNIKNAAQLSYGWPASNTTLFCHQEEPPELPCTEKAVTMSCFRAGGYRTFLTHMTMWPSLCLYVQEKWQCRRMYPDNTKMFQAQRTKIFFLLYFSYSEMFYSVWMCDIKLINIWHVPKYNWLN